MHMYRLRSGSNRHEVSYAQQRTRSCCQGKGVKGRRKSLLKKATKFPLLPLDIALKWAQGAKDFEPSSPAMSTRSKRRLKFCDSHMLKYSCYVIDANLFVCIWTY
jgi:hypothetical protein